MAESLWELWFGISVLIGFFLLIVLMPVSYFVLTRPFDKIVPRGFGPEYDLWFFSVLIGRPMGFAFQIVCPNYSRNVITMANWGDFNFRAKATRFQIIFSYVYIFLSIYLLIFGFIVVIHDFILN